MVADRYDEPHEVDYLMPQNLEAEQAALGAVLLGGDRARVVIDALVPSDFYRGIHQAIFVAARDVLQARQPVDTVTIATRLRAVGKLDDVGGFDYLDRLSRATPYSSSAGSYTDAVLAAAVDRATMQLGQRLVHRVGTADGTTDERLAEVEAALADVRRRQRGVRGGQWRSEAAYTELEARWHREATRKRYTTGLARLDKATDGGWPGGMHVLSAYTKAGKTHLAVDFALAAMRKGAKVGFLSLENDLRKLVARLVSHDTGLPYHNCLRGPSFCDAPDTFWRSAQLILECCVIDETTRCDVAEAEQRLRRLVEDHGCDFLIVDTANKITGEGKEERDRLQSVALRFEMLAHPTGLDLPLLVVCQQNRAGAKDPGLDTIHGSNEFAASACIVLTFKRDKEPGRAGMVHGTLTVAGNRDGESDFDVAMLGDCRTFRWTEDPDPPRKSKRAPADREARSSWSAGRDNY